MTLLALVIATAADAQDDRRASAGASVSATSMDSRTAWSFAGSFEYRINRVAGLEIEATVVPELHSNIPDGPTLALSDLRATLPPGIPLPTIFPPPRLENQRGRAVMLTNNVRVHIPTTTDRLDPYFTAGGGVASLRHTADYVYSPPVFTFVPTPGVSVPTPIAAPITQSIRSASTFTFHSRRSRNRRRPCQSLASPQRGSTQTFRLPIARSKAGVW